MAVGSLFFPAVIFFRRPWARIAAWVYCAFGALVWILVMNQFVSERMLIGRPWGKLVIILSVVASISLVAGALLTGERMRSWFRTAEKTA